MLTKGFVFLIVAVVILAVVAAYEYDHHPHPTPHPAPKPQPTYPAKYGMAPHPGQMIVPNSSSDWLYAQTVPATACDAQIHAYLTAGIPVGGANYGRTPGAPACHIFKPMAASDYHLANDPVFTAYLGQGHLQPQTPALMYGQDLEDQGY